MTPAGRAALIARAKSLAGPVASCVAARVRTDHLLSGLSWDELAALVVVLADAADPVWLREVTAADDGPSPSKQEVLLLRAHARAESLRKAGMEVPTEVRLLDSEYRRNRKRAQELAAVPGEVLAA